jgi:hypothetical protein
VGEQVMHSSKVYGRLGERLGLADHLAVLNVMLGRIAANLKLMSAAEEVVEATLALFQARVQGSGFGGFVCTFVSVFLAPGTHFPAHACARGCLVRAASSVACGTPGLACPLWTAHPSHDARTHLRIHRAADPPPPPTPHAHQDLASGYMSGKLLLRLEAAGFLLTHHTAEHFPFLGGGGSGAPGRARTTFYSTLARLLFAGDTPPKFRAFVAPLQQVSFVWRGGKGVSMKMAQRGG